MQKRTQRLVRCSFASLPGEQNYFPSPNGDRVIALMSIRYHRAVFFVLRIGALNNADPTLGVGPVELLRLNVLGS
jgi:hypothetical protein